MAVRVQSTRWLGLCIAIIWSLCGSTITAELAAAELAERLQPLIDAHAGQVAVAIKHLPTGATFTHQADRPMPTASLIKFPVMIAAYQAVAEGRVKLDQPITLSDADKVPGSGVLTTHFSAGTVLSLRDAIRLMIVYSDNTATNLVVDQIGLPATTALMEQLGAPHTRLHSQVYRRETSLDPARSQEFGLGSTTATEMIALFERLHARQLVSADASAAMLDHLYACDDESKFRRFLPRAKLAHKTGSVNAVRCDAGLIDSPAGAIAVCVLTSENKDQTWGDENAAEILCGKIAEAVFAHFNPDVPATSPPDFGPLRVGAQGPLVEGLQRTLNARLQPSPDLGVDGDFGSVTKAAVAAFQTARGLEASGVVGPETWAALGPLVEPDDDPNADAAETPLVKSPPDAATGVPFVTCKAWAIADATTGELVAAEQPDRPLDFASTTKIMTAYLVIRYAQQHPDVLQETVKFTARADETTGSTAAIRTGEQLTVGNLLYGLLLPSGNDASVALAEHFGTRLAAGTVSSSTDGPHDLFVQQMNAAAAELGMPATHFANPHGLSAQGHVSTARDLLRLARAALDLPLFEQVVNTPRHECVVTGPGGYQRHIVWKNTNRLLAIEGYDGVKTGTTTLAGACLVSRGRRDGRSLLVVVLGSTSSDARYIDSRNLFRWGWSQLQ